MERLPLLLLLTGLLTVPLVLQSARVRGLPVSGPLLGLLTGALVGPPGLDVLDLPAAARDRLLLESCRVLLAVSLLGVALRFPLGELRRRLRPVVLLVAVVMPLSAGVTAGLGVWLLDLPLALAVLLGACLCPTDPVLASDVVSGGPAERALPTSTRSTLSAESGANDGLALPLVLLALGGGVAGRGVAQEGLRSLYQVVVAVLVGGLAGVLAGRALQRSERRRTAERPSELVLTLLLALGVLGLARVLRTDGVLAVFACGLAYSGVVGARDREQQDTLDEVANRYAVVPFFLLLGAALPVQDWADLGAGAVLFPAAVLLLRRPPLVLALARPLGLVRRDAALLGWFGPMGVSAVFYLALSADEGARDPRLFAAGTLVVAASVVVHGLTAVPARSLYGRLSR